MVGEILGYRRSDFQRDGRDYHGYSLALALPADGEWSGRRVREIYFHERMFQAARCPLPSEGMWIDFELNFNGKPQQIRSIKEEPPERF